RVSARARVLSRSRVQSPQSAGMRQRCRATQSEWCCWLSSGHPECADTSRSNTGAQLFRPEREQRRTRAQSARLLSFRARDWSRGGLTRVAAGDQTNTSLVAEIRPRPLDEHDDAIAEADEVQDVN